MAFAEGIIPRLQESAEKGKVKGYAAKIKSRFGRGDSAHSPQEAPKKEKFSTPEFKRNFFVDRGNTTSAEVKGRRRETKEQSEWVQFSENTRNEFTSFLDNYATNLHGVMNTSGGAEILKAQPHTEQIYKMLSEGVSYDGTKEDDSKLKENIKKLLDKPSGWVLTKELIEQETALGLFALGLMTSDEGGKVDVNVQQILEDGKAKDPKIKGIWKGAAGGATGGWLAGATQDNWNVIQQKIGELASSVTLPTGAVPTYVTLGAVGGAALGYYLDRKGEKKRLDALTPGTRGEFVQFDHAIDMVKGDEHLAKYIKAVWKINVDDYLFDSTTGKFLRMNDEQSSTANIPGVLESLASNIKTRENYFDDLGIPKDSRDMVPEKKLLTKNAPSRTGERIDQQIQDKYNELRGKGKDDPKLYLKARELVLVKLTESFVSPGEVQPRKTLSRIDKEIQRREPGGDIYEEKKERDFSPGKKVSLELDRTALESIRDIPRTVENIRKNLDEVGAEREAFIRDTFSGATDPEQVKKEIRDTNLGSGSIIVNGKEITSITEQRNKAKEEFRNENRRIIERNTTVKRNARNDIVDDDNNVVMTVDQETQQTEILLREEEQKFQDKMVEINDQQNQLLALQTELESFEQKIKEIEETKKVAESAMPAYKDNYDELTGGTTSDTEITDAELASGNVDKLLDKINKLHTEARINGVLVGWPESENNYPGNRKKLMEAIVEAKAKTAKRFPGTPNDRERESALIELIREKYQDIAVQEKGMEDIDNSSGMQEIMKEKEKLLVIKDVLSPDSQERIFGSVDKIVRNPKEYFKGMPVSPENEYLYTDAELKVSNPVDPKSPIDRDYPEGYYTVMKYLFDYENKPDSEGYFRTINEIMPPDVMYDAMRQPCIDAGLVKTTSVPPNLGSLFSEISMNVSRLTPQNLRKIFVSMIDTVERKAADIK